MDHLEAYHLALGLVKTAGFKLHSASGMSETCYYQHPARMPLLLRISTHPSKKSPMGLSNVVARATFSPRDPYGFTEWSVHNAVAMAIGRYFLGEPKPSKYTDKKEAGEERPAQ